jgi:PAS domain S-box-containing protein
MARWIRSVALRYGLAVGAFVLILLLAHGIERFFSFKFEPTSLLIAAMIASAWYLGRGPGLLYAVVLELTLDYYSRPTFAFRPAVIIFNRMVLFVSLVLFASSRRSAENRLRQQREWLQVTLNSIGDAVIATDVDGSINFINPTAAAITGWTSAEAANRPLDEVFRIINEETHAPVESPLSIIKREGTVVGLANHTLLLAKDGTQIPIEDSGAPIRDSGGRIIGLIVVFHDVSERRRAEQEREQLLRREQSMRTEAEAANRLKDEFLATVSHELRTPLTAILGYAEMMRTGKLDDDNTSHAVEVVSRNARAQAEIIDDILDVSRIITGKFHIVPQPVELAPIIRAAVETLHPAAAAKAITLTVSLDEAAGFVAGDPDRLQQIIWNLASNAIKFTPQGGRVLIKLERVDSHLEFSVSDSGIGINEQFLPFIFERFRQADSSTTRAHGGLGLGLAIARHLVELHGGTVQAESSGEGHGAVFTMRLPLTTAREATSDSDNELNRTQETAEMSGGAPDLNGLRVLVVDDEPDTLEVLCVALNQCGAQVRAAGSSADALATLLEWKPNVLVSDLSMPGEDGFALIGKIRTLGLEEGGNIPAAALTAYVRDEDRLRALAAGYQTHISKPVDPTTLAAAVARLAKQTQRD